MNKSTENRVAIIGAGAAGLTASVALQKKGYTDVTVFERADRVGGKCSTVEIESKKYELGAGIIAASNRVVMRLAREFAVPIERVDFKKSIQVNAEDGSVFPKKNIFQKGAFYQELFLKYRKLIRKHPNVIHSGLSNIDSDLYLPFEVWAKKHGVETVARELEGFFTGYGYGYLNKIPAVYVLKYYSWQTVQAFIKRQIYRFPNGIQHLWTAVAKKQNVFLHTNIKKIQRGDTIRITTETEEKEYDRLIITSPLDETVQYMDVSEEEKTLFSHIEYVDYRTIVCEIEGLPDVSGYVPGNYLKERAGHPVFWYHRHADSQIYTFYVLGDWEISDTRVTAYTRKCIEKLGGTLITVQKIIHWKYFPHVSSERMKEGYFDRLESLQAKRKTYYAGEVMNFSTVGLSSAYAEDLVEKFF